MGSALSALVKEQTRSAKIIRTSIIGILANIGLSAFKAAIGVFSHSIAITLDAVNNLSDAASSTITIIGTKLATRPADHDHPYGHGRYEYLTTMVVSAIVLWAGCTALIEAVKGIVTPQTPEYNPLGLIIIAVAVVVKIALGTYFKRKGAELGSNSLVASGEDASFDAIISASTLVAAAIFLTTGVSLEAWLGAAISVVIIKSGIDMLREDLDNVLGSRIEASLARDIKATVCEVEGVRGAFDLLLNDYGPDRLQGSIHIEVSEEMSAREIDRITREIQAQVLATHHVVLHTVGIYSTNTAKDSMSAAIRTELEEITAENPHILQVHGLYVDMEEKMATFDLVVSFDAPNRVQERDEIIARLSERFPDYEFHAFIDADISD